MHTRIHTYTCACIRKPTEVTIGGFVEAVTVGGLGVRLDIHIPGEGRPQAIQGSGGNDRDKLWTEGQTTIIDYYEYDDYYDDDFL